MLEGWYLDDYLVLFDDAAARLTQRYGLPQYLPGLTAVGLRGWDDFILVDTEHRYFTLVTVPVEPKQLRPFAFSVDRLAIRPDARFAKKVKWYLKPVIFGGNPGAKENMTWVSLDQHAGLVRWWSKLYRDTVARKI